MPYGMTGVLLLWRRVVKLVLIHDLLLEFLLLAAESVQLVAEGGEMHVRVNLQWLICSLQVTRGWAGQ